MRHFLCLAWKKDQAGKEKLKVLWYFLLSWWKRWQQYLCDVTNRSPGWLVLTDCRFWDISKWWRMRTLMLHKRAVLHLPSHLQYFGHMPDPPPLHFGTSPEPGTNRALYCAWTQGNVVSAPPTPQKQCDSLTTASCHRCHSVIVSDTMCWSSCKHRHGRELLSSNSTAPQSCGPAKGP